MTPDYLASIRRAESGGDDAARNPRSSATGRYQFIDSTWRGLMDQYPDLGLTPDGRTDPAQQERAIQAFTRDNAAALQRAGIETTPANLYAAHFLGAGGAAQVLRQPDSAPLEGLLPPQVIAANPNLRGMTVADFRRMTARAGGGSYAPAPQNAMPQATPPQQNALRPELRLTDMRQDPAAFMSRGANALALQPIAYERRNALGSL